MIRNFRYIYYSQIEFYALVAWLLTHWSGYKCYLIALLSLNKIIFIEFKKKTFSIFSYFIVFFVCQFDFIVKDFSVWSNVECFLFNKKKNEVKIAYSYPNVSRSFHCYHHYILRILCLFQPRKSQTTKAYLEARRYSIIVMKVTMECAMVYILAYKTLKKAENFTFA